MPPDDLAVRIPQICADHAHLEGPLLPILHAVQAEYRHIPEGAVTPIAQALNISRAEVHGVITFYHDFREVPPGRTVVKLCRAEACQARGGQALGELARKLLNLDWQGTTPDGSITFEAVYCLGLCACGPAAMVVTDEGTTLHANLDKAALDLIAIGAQT